MQSVLFSCGKRYGFFAIVLVSFAVLGADPPPRNFCPKHLLVKPGKRETYAKRIRGSLLGLVWGDVFGAAVESWSSQEIDLIYGNFHSYPREIPVADIREKLPEKIKWLRILGIHTDDTQQALALLHVSRRRDRNKNLLAWQEEDYRNWGNLLVAGAPRAWRDTGKQFRAAVKNLEAGEDYRSSGSDSAGIGAAMRVGPLAAVYYHDDDLLADIVYGSTLVTHADLRAASIGYALAWANAAFIRGERLHRVRSQLVAKVKKAEDRWIQRAEEWNVDPKFGNVVSSVLQKVFAKGPGSMTELGQRVLTIASEVEEKDFTQESPNHPFSLIGGVYAVAMGLLPSAPPMYVLSHIVRQGHDTDTVCAMTGSLLGARFGDGWLPLDRLYEKKRLEGYAQALVTGEPFVESEQSFLRREAILTNRQKSKTWN